MSLKCIRRLENDLHSNIIIQKRSGHLKGNGWTKVYKNGKLTNEYDPVYWVQDSPEITVPNVEKRDTALSKLQYYANYGKGCVKYRANLALQRHKLID